MESDQKWQSEFLAIGCVAIFSVYLGQSSSPRVETRRDRTPRHRRVGLFTPTKSRCQVGRAGARSRAQPGCAVLPVIFPKRPPVSPLGPAGTRSCRLRWWRQRRQETAQWWRCSAFCSWCGWCAWWWASR
ncbi:DUF6766 family protein [Amycolatopsis sp. NPDC049253]|uniref:DUF6766 family protein n=1 Tax=Amycolatopsis sp. NPDC049253 TaxID=3155274 RepID=UPI003415CF1A